MSASAKTMDVCQIEFRIIRRDGEQSWIGQTCLPIYDDKGTYLGRPGSNLELNCRNKMENIPTIQKKEVIETTSSQEKANEALKTILDQREIEKNAVEQTMVANLKRFVFPYLEDLEQLKIGKDVQAYVNIIRSNIEQLILPLSNRLSRAYLDLTPTEVKVADLIRQGMSTKSIAAILKTAPSTVEKHRNKIRKKLNLLKKKINLQTYLNSLA